MKSFLGRILCRIGIHRWRYFTPKAVYAGRPDFCVLCRKERPPGKKPKPPNGGWNEEDGAIF